LTTPSAAFASGDLDPYEYSLAERLGGMTVRELRRRMDCPELAEWIAFDRYKAGRQEQAHEKARLVGKMKDRAKRRGRRR
jgi:hypothetical protein